MAGTRGALFGFLVGVRLVGWALAWGALGVGALGLFRVMLEQPGTLEGTWKAALGRPLRTRAASAHDSKASNHRHEVARSLVADGVAGRGEELYRRLLAETPDHADYNLELGELLLAKALLPEAERYLRRATVLAPERPNALARLAEVRVRLGLLGDGLATRRRAAELGADLHRVDRELARRYLEAREFAQAIRFFRAVDPEGRDPEVQFLLARAWYESASARSRVLSFRLRAEEFGHAREHVEKVLALDPTHQDAVRLKEEL